MSKPSQRHASHVQPEKKDAVDKLLPTAPVAAEITPSVRVGVESSRVGAESPDPAPMRDKAQGGIWFATVIWTFVFGFLFVYLLIDLIVSLFRK